MMTQFTRSWELFKVSIAVTLRHRKLLLFPLLIALLTAGIALFFISAMALPVVLSAIAAAAAHSATTAHSVRHSISPGNFHWGSLLLLPLYFLSMVLATFFNVAFYNEIMEALHGRGVSFRRGLSVAWSRWPSIIAWSLLAGLVGWLIRTIQERLPFLARIVTGFIGMAWSIAAVFVIPVIIREQHMSNPFKILQESAMTLKRTWGEGLIGYMGFSAGSMVIFGCSLPPLLLAGALAWFFKSVWIIGIGGGLWLLGLFLAAYVSSVAGHVYRCALYIYAAEGAVPESYNKDMLDMAWKVRKS